MASPAVHSVVANVSKAMLGGAVQSEVRHWKVRMGADVFISILVFGCFVMLLSASYFYFLQLWSPPAASLAVAGELAGMSVVIWLFSRRWLH